MSQNTQIITHLKEYSGITPLEALTRYGIMRLASRINELRRLGHNIKTIIIQSDTKRYAKYVLR